MTGLFLPIRKGAAAAVAHFRRPRLKNLYGLLAPPVRIATPGDPSSRIPPFIELLWMPAYAIRFRTVLREKRDTVWASVDGWTAHFALFDCAGDLGPRDPIEEALPWSVDEAHAVDIARKGLLQYILRQRGQFNKPLIEEVEEIRPYHFPVWVCYYRRRNCRLDIRAFDGFTGSAGGAKMRVAVLNALIAARKQRATNGYCPHLL